MVGNLLIIGVLGGGFIYLKKRKQKMAASLEGEMDEDVMNDKPGSEAKDK